MVPRLHPCLIMLKQTDALPKDQHLQRAYQLYKARTQPNNQVYDQNYVENSSNSNNQIKSESRA